GDKTGFPTYLEPGAFVFPAPAGINRGRGRETMPADSVPRASGDKPPYTVAKFLFLLCSPRQRG
ncbi:hypothetical protein SEEM8387_13665, partial [Salmonella enterica subsp. enterica serovar Montevideo str. 8387]